MKTRTVINSEQVIESPLLIKTFPCVWWQEEAVVMVPIMIGNEDVAGIFS